MDKERKIVGANTSQVRKFLIFSFRLTIFKFYFKEVHFICTKDLLQQGLESGVEAA